MTAIEETTTVQPNGSVVLRHPELKPGEQVKVIVLLGPAHVAAERRAATGRKLKGDWGGVLTDLGKQYSSVEMQHKANEWRGD